MKEYPERPDTKTYPVCECGHTNHGHRYEFDITLEKDKTKYFECTHCMCPEYKFEKDMTSSEISQMHWDAYWSSKKKK